MQANVFFDEHCLFQNPPHKETPQTENFPIESHGESLSGQSVSLLNPK